MTVFEEVPQLRNPVVIAAFEGWNDAGDAASECLRYLANFWQADAFAALDPEEFYDFQVNRPTIDFDATGLRHITWPSTQILIARPADLDRDVILIEGIEPNMRWRRFCSDLLEIIGVDLDASLVITLGALLADTPHSRTLPISGTANREDLRQALGLEPSNYTGPTGIVGVLMDACLQRDLPAVSLWVSVPHYAAAAPCPKAKYALLKVVASFLGAELDWGQAREEVEAWEQTVASLLEEEDEIREYVASLEESVDTAELPEASGDAIAREFERYLQGHQDGES